MSTYNGQTWIQEQLESIYNQINVRVEIVIRDDGSLDSTNEFLEDSSLHFGTLFHQGENVGPEKSFLNLIKSTTCEEYIALADQDDVWFPNKIFRATNLLAPFVDVPALYCSNVQFSSNDSLDSKISNLPDPALPLSLFQNSAMGCTIVFNKKAHEIIRQSSGRSMIMHDWYVFLIILTTGKVIFDPEPHISYRLHEKQFIGWKQKRNFRTFLSPEIFRQVLDQWESIHEEYEYIFTPEARDIFDVLKSIRAGGFIKRIVLLTKGDLTLRQNFYEDFWTKLRLLFS